jgi:hypothetical protein
MRKLAGMAWENPQRHFPRIAPADGIPEVLIAVCTVRAGLDEGDV